MVTLISSEVCHRRLDDGKNTTMETMPSVTCEIGWLML